MAARNLHFSGIPVALVYPNTARVGLSNLGFQFVSHVWNAHPLFSVERFFVETSSLSDDQRGVRVVSEKGQGSLSSFPIVAFSLPFENDYPAVISALLATNVGCFTSQRSGRDPLVVAGGVSISLNPEPLALVFDVIFIGEIEEERGWTNFLDALAAVHLKKINSKSWDRSQLEGFRDTPGAYVPDFYRFRHGDDGRVEGIEVSSGAPLPVKAVKRVGKTDTLPTALIQGKKAVFDESILVEINRGCSRGCRFCAAGWIHHPVRYRSLAQFSHQVMDQTFQGRTIGLIGSDLAGHPELLELLHYIVDKGGKFSLSSIRPEGLTPALIKLIAAVGQKTVTLAPETASPRMKKIIGKPLPDDLFLEKIDSVVAHGIPNVRFYFMIGLPTETEEDVRLIVDFMLRARGVFVSASRSRKKIGRMSVQINAFVPKPWTPFQWAAMESPKAIERKIKIIRDGFAGVPNIVVRAESVRESILQGYLSRGDRQVGIVLYEALAQRRRFSAVLKRGESRADLFLYRERQYDEVFPWDVVDHGIRKTTLRRIFEKALSE